MSAVGIICEYNPFHKGHEYHIQKAREKTGADVVVAVMNGDFVQRGEPAIWDKYTRTRMALQGGADMVLELPVRYGISGAGDFAYGGILALHSLGFVDSYCFGSEEVPEELLKEAACFFAEETEEYGFLLRTFLEQGFSFPAAREQAFCHGFQGTADSYVTWSDEELGQLFSPNNILAIEYMKAAQTLGTPMKPVVITREGMGYHQVADEWGKEDDTYWSATAIRQQIKEGVDITKLKGMSQKSLEVPDKEAVSFVTAEDFWSMCGYAICQHWEELEQYKDISEELANAFRKNWYRATSFTDFINQCKTKNLTMSRIKRGVFQVLLGVKKELAKDEAGSPLPYLRLLGVKKEAAALLGQVPDTVIIGRLAKDQEKLTPAAQKKLAQDVRSADLYRMISMQKSGRLIPEEYRRGVIIY